MVPRISLTKDAAGEGTSRRLERVRCLRAGPYTSPSGSFGHQSPGTTAGAGGAPLGWDRRRRVTPAQTASQETWPEAEPWGRRLPLVRAVVERRQASALCKARAASKDAEDKDQR